MPTTCVWLDGLASSITEQYLTRHFCRYGHVVKVNSIVFSLFLLSVPQFSVGVEKIMNYQKR